MKKKLGLNKLTMIILFVVSLAIVVAILLYLQEKGIALAKAGIFGKISALK